MTDFDRTPCGEALHSEHTAEAAAAPVDAGAGAQDASCSEETLATRRVEKYGSTLSSRAPAAEAPAGADFSSGWAGENPAGGKLFVWFFLGMLFFSLYLMYALLQPFVNTIILAFLFTAICHPFYFRCLRLTKGRAVPAALLVLTCLMFLVVIPIIIFIIGLIPQAGKSIAAINNWLVSADINNILHTHVEPIILWLSGRFPELDLSAVDIRGNFIAFSRQTGQYLLSSGTYILGNTVMFVAHLALMFLIMFFALIDGITWVRRLEYLFPLKPEQTMVIVASLRRMARAVLVGGFCVAALQGIVGGIGLAFVGIPALFWGTVMVFAALVPVLGTGLVWVPAVVYLLVTEQWTGAIFLTLWCGVGVTGIDSFLRPFLIRDGAKVSVLFIFLSILGGVMSFGMIGLLYGPIILGLVVVMIEIYSQEYKRILESRTLTPQGGGGEDNRER